MKRRHIKLFEEVSYPTYEERVIFDAIYEEWKRLDGFTMFKLYESDDFFDDESTMSSGEERAFNRGLQIMSKSQMATLYLFALGKEEEVAADYLKLIPGIEGFLYSDESDPSFINITIPSLADAIGMNSDRTITRTINKFRNLIKGEGETSGEVLYPKLISAYEALSKMNPNQIALRAEDAIQDISYTVNRDKVEARNDKARTSRQERDVTMLKIGESIYKLVLGLKDAGLGIEKALPMAISKVSRETGEEGSFIDNSYRKYLKELNIPNARAFIV